jgi:voltage-gated potassium channel
MRILDGTAYLPRPPLAADWDHMSNTTKTVLASRQSRWQGIAEWPLAITALLFLVAYAWQVIGNLQGASAAITEAIIIATWAIFVTDYIVTLTLAERRWHWFRTHLFDLMVVALPILRPLRLLRLVTLLSVLQRTAGAAFRGWAVIYVAGASALLVFVAALAVLDSERSAPGASITTFPEALWWAFVTVTTVGYGDLSPITDQGRIIAVFLMLGGIALIGVITATLASWIVERVSESDAEKEAATRGELRQLGHQIEALQAALRSKD